MLGRHVGGCADQPILGAHQLCEPEVGQHDVRGPFTEEEVLGLQIQVHEVPCVAVRQRVEELQQHDTQRGPVELDIGERTTWQALERTPPSTGGHMELAVVDGGRQLPEGEHRQHARVVDPGLRAHFSLERQPVPGRRGVPLAAELHGEHGVRCAVTHLPDRAHAAFAQQTKGLEQLEEGQTHGSITVSVGWWVFSFVSIGPRSVSQSPGSSKYTPLKTTAVTMAPSRTAQTLPV